MAIPLLAKEIPDDYVHLLEAREGGTKRLSELERERFGWTHADAAGLMANNWSLPEEFAELIISHVDLEQTILTGQPGKIAVSLSALLPAASDESWSDLEGLEEAYLRLRPEGAPQLLDVLQQVDQGFTEFAPVLKLATPARSLVQQYQECGQESVQAAS